jgi:hypothetical protein
MNDRKKKIAMTDKEYIDLAQQMVVKALKRPRLRNEAICQVIKQTTNHTNPYEFLYLGVIY